MKTCTKCKQTKPTNEFRKRTKSNDGLSSQCKACLDTTSELWRKRNLQKRTTQIKARRDQIAKRFAEWKSIQGCKCCSERTAVCLDIHHLDPSEKEGNPSKYVGYSWEILMEEVKKCIVVCRNCHAKIHAGIISV